MFLGYGTASASKYRITTANNTELKCLGTVSLNVFYEGKRTFIHSLVSDNLHEDFLISWSDLRRMGVLSEDFPHLIKSTPSNSQVHSSSSSSVDTFEGLIDEFQDVFRTNEETVTPMHTAPMHIHLRRNDPDYKPLKVNVARKTPKHYQTRADDLIKNLLASGVIVKVPTTEHVEWCSPGFFVPKPNNAVRFVVDYRHLNTFIDRPVHPFPSCRDILHNIKHDSKWFLKFDMTWGYFQIPLDDESSKLTTFLLESGRYRFVRAPMGLNPSSDNFCERTDFAFATVLDLLKIVDDGLLQAPSKPVLLKSFREVLECCRKHNLSLCKSKLELGQSVVFAGYEISKDGVRPQSKKTDSISKFPVPKNLHELRSFLGLANQLGIFIPDFAHVTADLRGLLKKNVAYLWLPEHQAAFDKVRKLLTSPLLIKPFEVNKPTFLLTDASRLHGLGFALMQKDPDASSHSLIQCGSRSLNSAESRYSTSELECLAIYHAIKECQFYLQGADFTVLTDHRPLKGVFRKPLAEIENARLLRFREKLTDYSFDVDYVPGKTHLIADALSRAPLFDPPEEEAINVNATLTNKLAADPALQQFYDAAANDPSYLAVVKAIIDGKSPAVLPPSHPARTFKSIWDDLSVQDDLLLILNDSRLVVPSACRQKVLSNLHASHAGISKTRQLARNLYYWPGMSASIQTLIENCEECQTLRPSQNDAIQFHPPAEEPMHSVSADLFECKGRHYLAMVDRFSYFIWVKELRRLGTDAVVSAMQTWFKDLGYPFIMVSDNGPQFREDFKAFCRSNFIIHSPSSAYNPRSNGLAESAVKAAKHLLLKSTSFADFEDSLFAWRNTPTSGSSFSPAEKFYNRRQRSSLFPALPSLSLPTPAPPPHTSRLPVLHVGDPVFLQHPISKLWNETGMIEAINPSTLSFLVRRGDGSIVSRGRRLLRAQKTHGPQETNIPPSGFVPITETPPGQKAGQSELDDETVAPNVTPLHRSRRQRRQPDRLVYTKH